MTSSQWVLIGVVVVFWTPFVFDLRRKSMFPVIPILPAVAFVAGFLLNRWIDWAGTIGIAALHAVPTAVVAIGNRRELFSRGSGKGSDAT